MLPFMAYCGAPGAESPLSGTGPRLLRARAVPRRRRLHRGVPHDVFNVRSMETILAAAAALGALVAAPVGALCVRYVKIYFGMLTLAFGMVFYTFRAEVLPPERAATRACPSCARRSSGGASRTSEDDYLVARTTTTRWPCSPGHPRHVAHRPLALRLCLKPSATIRQSRDARIGVARYRWCAFVISAVYAAVGGALSGRRRATWIDVAYWTQSGNIVFMTLLAVRELLRARPPAPSSLIYLQDWVMSVGPVLALIFARSSPRSSSSPPAARGFWVRRPPSGRGLVPRASSARGAPELYGQFCALDGVSLAISAGSSSRSSAERGGQVHARQRPHRRSSAPPPARHLPDADVRGSDPRLAGIARSFQLVRSFRTSRCSRRSRRGVSRLRARHRLFASSPPTARFERARSRSPSVRSGRSVTSGPTCPRGQEAPRRGIGFALRPQIILLDEPTSG